jgi:hypothetical protein
MGSADEIGKKRWPCCVSGRSCVRAHFIGKCVGCKSLVLSWLAKRRRQLGFARRRWGAGAYAVPFICAISDTSPTRKLNVTFLQSCAMEPQYAHRSRGQRTAAYNCRSVGICAMLVGSVPVKRFSPNSLPGRHQ